MALYDERGTWPAYDIPPAVPGDVFFHIETEATTRLEGGNLQKRRLFSLKKEECGENKEKNYREHAGKAQRLICRVHEI